MEEEENNDIWSKNKKYFIYLNWTAIMSFGLVNFNMQNKLAEGGFTGITLLILLPVQMDPPIPI